MKTSTEKRRQARILTDNLISYICINNNNSEASQGIGRTLNISQGGLLIESHTPVETERILLTTVNEKNELMEIRAKVAYCREAGPGIFHTGVRFLERNKRIRQIVVGMIKTFNLQKNKGQK